MIATSIRHLVLVLGALLLPALAPAQRLERIPPRVHVGIRTIGHAVLLAVGDSTSLVLPVQREADTYLITFGTEFGFVPERVAAVVDSVMRVTRLSKDYVVEVERCGTREVVHSYERSAADTLNIMPCTSRALPQACYTMRVTLLDAGGTRHAVGRCAGGGDQYPDTAHRVDRVGHPCSTCGAPCDPLVPQEGLTGDHP
jgi:hypothetical protein